MSRASTTSPVYFPQLADGGGYTTALILSNTSGSPQTGTIAIFDNSGAALTVRPTNGVVGSTFSYTIPAGGAYILQTDGSPASARAGWARVTPAAGSTSPAGAGVFSYSPAGILVTESGVPSATATTRARLYVDKSKGHDTGIAIANPGSSAAPITLQMFEKNGTSSVGDGSALLNVPSNGHMAAFVGQLISGLPDGFTGVAELTSVTPFVPLTHRSLTNGRGDFLLTTFPVADATQLPPSPMVFPHIADGSGYSTQFIFISASGSASVGVNFIGDDGSPLDVGRIQ
jgi:hypothetical protein